MKLQHVEVYGAGQAVRVHLFIGEADNPEASRQWLEGKVEFRIEGVMDEADLQRAALTRMRNAIDAQIAAIGVRAFQSA